MIIYNLHDHRIYFLNQGILSSMKLSAFNNYAETIGRHKPELSWEPYDVATLFDTLIRNDLICIVIPLHLGDLPKFRDTCTLMVRFVYKEKLQESKI